MIMHQWKGSIIHLKTAFSIDLFLRIQKYYMK